MGVHATRTGVDVLSMQQHVDHPTDKNDALSTLQAGDVRGHASSKQQHADSRNSRSHRMI
jgi:hypothetical protein